MYLYIHALAFGAKQYYVKRIKNSKQKNLKSIDRTVAPKESYQYWPVLPILALSNEDSIREKPFKNLKNE